MNNLFELSNISRYRSSLMGLAILWVFLFHVGGIGVPYIDSVLAKGYLGVDIFFFLSGWGLCHSLEKSPDLKSFYVRRMMRIIPTWWLIIGSMAILQVIMHLPHPHTIGQFILYFSGLGYWMQDAYLGTDAIFVTYYEWYIPTLLAFYLIAPVFAKSKARTNILLLLLSILVVCTLKFAGIAENLSISYARLPIFILGFLLYQIRDIEPKKSTFLALVGGGILIIYIATVIMDRSFEKYEFIATVVSIPMFAMMIGRLIESMKLNRSLAFLGSISMELYLLHIYNRLSKIIEVHVSVRIVALLLAFALLVFLSWAIHKVMNRCTNCINQKKK